MKKCSLFVTAILVIQVAFTQKIVNTESLESSGFSSERLQRIYKNMNEWVSKGWIQGSVGMVIRNGKIVYYNAAGYNDIEAKAPMQKDAIFRIASQTKAITSVAVMMLYEEGKFMLDDPVSKYIPSFVDEKVLDKFNEKDSSYTTVPAKRQITIRDLLTHTSGISYGGIGTKEASAIYAKNKINIGLEVKDEKLSAIIDRLGQLPLMHQPGEKWTYGLNIDVLGDLVEIWSGRTLDEFFRKRIFEPLGMKDTYFNLPKEKASRLVSIYNEDSLGHLVKQQDKQFGSSVNYPLENKTSFSGGGGLSSTIYDYAIFLQMMLNGGEYNGVRLLSRNTVRMMTMNQIGELGLDENKFGLGFMIVSDKGSSLFPSQEGTYGWGGIFSTSYWVDPKEKMIILFYRQTGSTTHKELGDKFRVLAYQALND